MNLLQYLFNTASTNGRQGIRQVRTDDMVNNGRSLTIRSGQTVLTPRSRGYR